MTYAVYLITSGASLAVLRDWLLSYAISPVEVGMIRIVKVADCFGSRETSSNLAVIATDLYDRLVELKYDRLGWKQTYHIAPYRKMGRRIHNPPSSIKLPVPKGIRLSEARLQLNGWIYGLQKSGWFKSSDYKVVSCKGGLLFRWKPTASRIARAVTALMLEQPTWRAYVNNGEPVSP